MIASTCKPLFDDWHLGIAKLTYLLYCALIVLILRVLHAVFRALAVQTGDFPHENNRSGAIEEKFWKAFWLCIKGHTPFKEHNDLWLPALVGFIEIAVYPVLLVLGQFVLIGGWLGIKTAGAWMGWKASRTSFNRFLLFNLIALLLSYFWLSKYIEVTPCQPGPSVVATKSDTSSEVSARQIPHDDSARDSPTIIADHIGVIAIGDRTHKIDPPSFLTGLAQGDSGAITALAALVGAGITGFIGWIAFRFNQNTLRGQAAHDQITMLLGIDGHLIERPKLWWIWDDKDQPGPIQDKPIEAADVAQRNGLIAAYFNMFEVIYEFYFHTIKRQTKEDKRKWDAWERYIFHFFANSQEARNLFPGWAHLYTEDFAAKINSLIKRATPAQQ